MKPLILLSLLSLSLIFTSCYPSRVSTTSSAMLEADDLYANSWDLVELNGTTFTRSGDRYSYITFTPGSNRISGYTSCNYIGGTIGLTDKNGITFSPVVTTKNSCVGNSWDASFVPALRNVDTWGMVDDHLVMYNDGKIVARWAPSSFSDDDLYGNWQLAYISDATTPFDELYPVDKRPTVTFTSNGNVVTGTTGYNTFTCPMTLNSHGIAFKDCSVTKTPCEGVGESMFLDDLKMINTYTLTDKNTLVLVTDDNTVLRFTRMK